jgi:hypothetical protein
MLNTHIHTTAWLSVVSQLQHLQFEAVSFSLDWQMITEYSNVRSCLVNCTYLSSRLQYQNGMAMFRQRDGCGKTCKTYGTSQVLGQSRIDGQGKSCTGTAFESENGQTLWGDYELNMTNSSTYPTIRTRRGATQIFDSDIEVWLQRYREKMRSE